MVNSSVKEGDEEVRKKSGRKKRGEKEKRRGEKKRKRKKKRRDASDGSELAHPICVFPLSVYFSYSDIF